MAIDGGLYHLLRDRFPRGHWVRVESGSMGPGTPDVNVCMGGVESWLELKKTDAWKVRIRGAQVGWCETRSRHGGRVFVATRRVAAGGSRSEPADELWIHRGADIRLLEQLGLREAPPPLLRCGGGPARWDWARLQSILFGSGDANISDVG